MRALGIGWQNQPPASFEDLTLSICSSVVNLNIGSERRPFEVAGCGGFLMTTPVDGLEACFEFDRPGRRRFAEVVGAESVEEMAGKIRYYAVHSREREHIAARAHERALREHTWYHRFDDLFRRLGWRFPKPPISL